MRFFPQTVLAFIRETQQKEWAKLESLHGDKTGEQILGDLCKWMDIHGVLATLRHGFKCYGRTLRIAFFKAAHELNPELNARYDANRVGLTRQLHFSPRSEQSLDVTLSVNGLPVATLELKNPLTGQTVEDARKQYRQDRDPREPIFEFKRRTLVHFAVDTESVLMTTRLAGAATHFLPFDKGCDGGAGNPPDPKGRAYRTVVPMGRGAATGQPARSAGAICTLAGGRETRRSETQGEGRDDDLPALPSARGRAPSRGSVAP